MYLEFMNGTFLSNNPPIDENLAVYLNAKHMEEWLNKKNELKLYEISTNKLLHHFVVKVGKNGECFMYDKVKKKSYRDKKCRYFLNVLTGRVEAKMEEKNGKGWFAH